MWGTRTLGVFAAATTLACGLAACAGGADQTTSAPSPPLPTAATTGSGWVIAELVKATVLDTLPDRLLVSHTDPTSDVRSVYLIDRSTGQVLWRRDRLVTCFFETSDRIWCLPARRGVTPAVDWHGTDRVVIDGDRVTRLKGGSITDARSAAARNRGDVDRPATIATTTNTTGLYGSVPVHEVHVRRRSDNALIADIRPEKESNSLSAVGGSYRGGFAAGVFEHGSPHLDLFDENGVHVRRVDGASGISCELPVLRFGSDPSATRLVLMDPRTGDVRYEARQATSQRDSAAAVECGADYLINGTQFVDARDGHTVDLALPEPPKEYLAYSFAADDEHIAAVSRETITVYDRRTGRVTTGTARMPRGTQVEHADATSVVVTSVDGLQDIRY